MRTRIFTAVCLCGLIGSTMACGRQSPSLQDASPQVELKLPDGFRATVVIDSVGPARHLAIDDEGDIYTKLMRSYPEGSIAALRDTTGDGRADIVRKFGVFEDQGTYHTGAAIRDGYLYVSTDLVIYRYRLPPEGLVPRGPPDTVMIDNHAHGTHEHNAKPITFDGRGNMYIPFGGPNNACQEPKRTPGAPGLDPCPYLKDHAGVWRFDADGRKQTQAEGHRIATGIRSVTAMRWNPFDGQLYVVVHGRDDLHRLFPNIFTPWDNAMLPAEEFIRVTEGSDFGWPYCYYDQMQDKKVLAPEYGGNGRKVGRCAGMNDPLIGFPGHFAPNDLVFYRGDQFPERYRGGAFIAFHGSTIRNPYPQAGYFIAFVPFENGPVSGAWEVFANGFAGSEPIVSVSDAAHRPSGIAVGPEGALYVADDRGGAIWKITFEGDRASFGPDNLEEMAREKQKARNIRTPAKVKDNLRNGTAVGGEKLYHDYCAPCHQEDGQGTGGRFPPLAGTDWVTGDKKRLITVILKGLEGRITVGQDVYNGTMPQHSFLSDEEVANVATYIRQNFGNEASAVSAPEVARVRIALHENISPSGPSPR